MPLFMYVVIQHRLCAETKYSQPSTDRLVIYVHQSTQETKANLLKYITVAINLQHVNFLNYLQCCPLSITQALIQAI